MAFDQSTRNRLARFVGEARALLTEEFTRQMQHEYGLDPLSGEITAIEKLTALDDARRETARILRENLDYYLAAFVSSQSPSPAGSRVREVLERIVREQAFTVLNRLCALRMAEGRGLLIESVGRGYQSRGFQLYARLAGSALGETGDAYRSYLFSIFDEFALDLPVLFDRFSPQGRLFPREGALLRLLELINKPEIEPLWAEDETIGWIYQYFNSVEERQEMRRSRSPRNSRELAVRNQFFTPRYVVEFLTDNTLGRIWYEMTKGETALKDTCRYLVRRPNEIFLADGESAPSPASDESDAYLLPNPLKQVDEDAANPLQRVSSDSDADFNRRLLRQPVYIPHRPLKDPREIKMLDPACGSMHFGLYAFDLFERIYAEAWELEEQLGAEALWRMGDLRPLHETYPDKAAFLRDVPRLILERNIHGIDIDPRAVQIAGLSLWLRAQKSWQAQGLKPHERPQIRKSNIVCAEPMPGDRQMLEEFLATLSEDKLEALMRQTWQAPAGQKIRVTKQMAQALAKLVRTVWQEMELAGEAGSLLKIEETLRKAIAAARQEAQEKSPLFRVLDYGLNEPPKEQYVQAMAGEDQDFFDRAEGLVLAALHEYAEQAANGAVYRRRLFGEDAVQGFAFIDLFRKQYDVVLMNPPFGDPSKGSKKYIEDNYTKTKGDILANFLERALGIATNKGRVGTITNRTCFFLTTQSKLRRELFQKQGFVELMADFGHGVLDAMVETAAYTISRERQIGGKSIFVRCLMFKDKDLKLQRAIEALNADKFSNLVFIINPDEFSRLKGSPYCYWISTDVIRKVARYPSLEGNYGTIRVGLQTGEDWRFLRLAWEVPNNLIGPAPLSLTTPLEFKDTCITQFNQEKKWAFFSKTESALPWFSPIVLILNYKKNGYELKNFFDTTGQPKSVLRSPEYYFLPGFSYMLRSTRLVPYIVPAGVIPTAGRAQVYPKEGKEYYLLGYCASLVASAIARFSGENFGQPKFQASIVQNIPVPELSRDLTERLSQFIEREYHSRRLIVQQYEPYQEFALPGLLFNQCRSSIDWSRYSLLGWELELEIAEAMGVSEIQLDELARDIRESLEMQYCNGVEPADSSQDDEDEELATVSYIEDTPKTQYEELVSYLLGLAFGRWDIRFALDKSLLPNLPDAFHPIPVCPPASLVSPNGLPASPENIASEHWLRLRRTTEMLPVVERDDVIDKSGNKYPANITDQDYPLKVAWSGVLVDDPDSLDDIVRRVRETLSIIFKNESEIMEMEIISALEINSLRNYFTNFSDNGFWADHLRRYSMNRRQAPIYWALSTPSFSYTLWLYYHRLNDQILYTCVNDFVEPKLKQVSEEAARLRHKRSRSAADEKELERLTDFECELKDFRAELLRVAAFWKPNLNDGVQITAAPLWRLFQHKPWQKKLKETWEKLERGDYDWAHLAYSIWPERVREKCKSDKSLAIAHDLEHLYVEPKTSGKKKTRRKEIAEPEMESFFDEEE